MTRFHCSKNKNKCNEIYIHLQYTRMKWNWYCCYHSVSSLVRPVISSMYCYAKCAFLHFIYCYFTVQLNTKKIIVFISYIYICVTTIVVLHSIFHHIKVGLTLILLAFYFTRCRILHYMHTQKQQKHYIGCSLGIHKTEMHFCVSFS
jgi:hypothetical protein